MKEIKRYSKQFKMEAIRLVKGQGYKILEAECNLALTYTGLSLWWEKECLPQHDEVVIEIAKECNEIHTLIFTIEYQGMHIS